MNPLLSFWIKVQPLAGGFGTHSWKAISQSSTIASSSGDDATVQRTTTTSSFWFFYLKGATTRLASHVLNVTWLLNPVISRMQDAPILKPSSIALCEGLQRYTTRKVDTRVDVKRFTKSSDANTTHLQQSQQLLQQQDYTKYQISPPVRRNSKEWVREYKKERIDKINYNNVFGGMSEASNNEIPTLPPPSPVVATEVGLAQSRSSESDNSNYLIHPNSPTSSTTSSTTTVAENVPSISLSHPPPTIISNKTHNGPCSNDVICGRGGKANTHPGNISFREEAKKLRSWYESSSKSEKFTISSFLVDIVGERGGRFLKRNPEQPGKWLEADGSDVRKKASQALREGRRSAGQ
mmetsp:Transcript_25297/g.41499  ORF Transcript_25297/g.41499 Transcript_25297/m.41499 type:complete len:351 (+) Transcript_25297:190-1242(+)